MMACPQCHGDREVGDGGGNTMMCNTCEGTGRVFSPRGMVADNAQSELERKLTNPKDVIGSDKLPLHLIPTPALAEVALAFLEGALKYGTANWRKAGVRASIYRSAGLRHGDKWWNGESRDPDTRVHHIASRIACDMILLDAELAGMLNDDRPPSVKASKHIDDLTDNTKHLKALFKDHDPKHYTIKDADAVQ